MLGCRSGSMYLFQIYPRDLLFLISCVPTDQNESHKLESPPCSGRHTIAFHEQKKGPKPDFSTELTDSIDSDLIHKSDNL